MRRSIRTVFVCLLVALITYQPALACRSCGGWGGGHYAPTYYSGPVAYSGGCSSCGGNSGCSDCGYEIVVSDCCGGCSSCGGQQAATSERAPKAPFNTTKPPEKTVVAPPVSEP